MPHLRAVNERNSSVSFRKKYLSQRREQEVIWKLSLNVNKNVVLSVFRPVFVTPGEMSQIQSTSIPFNCSK